MKDIALDRMEMNMERQKLCKGPRPKVLWMYSFFPLYLSCSMHFCSFHGLSCFPLCSDSFIAQTLLYLTLHMTNGNVPLVQTPCIASLFHAHLHPILGYAVYPCLFSSMLWLCHSPFHFCYASILEAVCLIPLISVYDSPLLTWVQDMNLYNIYWQIWYIHVHTN